MSNQTWTAKQVGDRYGKSAAWVNAKCRAKAWPHLAVGNTYRFTDSHVAAIDALLEVAMTQQAKAANEWGTKGRSA